MNRMLGQRELSGEGVVILVVVLLSALWPSGCSSSSSPSTVEQPAGELQYVTPQQVGWSFQKLDTARQCAQQSGYATVMAAYEGKVFFSWGKVSRNFFVHSIREPFLSALFGIPVNRGDISLAETLEQFGMDDI
jgi:hypothetical protein